MQYNQKKIYSAFRFFINRFNPYALMKDGLNEYFVIKKDLEICDLKEHLDGKITLGVFQISTFNKVKWICWDFDSENENDLEETYVNAKQLFDFLKGKNYNPILEFSGRRGYHIWIFCEPVDTRNAKEFGERMAKSAKSNANEIFPKQKELKNGMYGSMVKLPLGIHKVSNKRSFIFDYNLNKLKMGESLDFLINSKKDIIPTSLNLMDISKNTRYIER